MILDELLKLQDTAYADFQAKLTPGIPRERFIGVRIPELRKLTKSLWKEAARQKKEDGKSELADEIEQFMRDLPHRYYDEDMLHGLFIEQLKNYDECVKQLQIFLPYVDNWAVCDIMSPKILKKDLPLTMELICAWSASPETYTCRFGLELLMSHFLDDAFHPEYLEIPASVRSEDYYVKMMVAWFFATALAKQWDAAVPYIEEKRLAPWIHNKTIRKAIESYRITDEQKAYLRTLKVK